MLKFGYPVSLKGEILRRKILMSMRVRNGNFDEMFIREEMLMDAIVGHH